MRAPNAVALGLAMLAVVVGFAGDSKAFALLVTAPWLEEAISRWGVQDGLEHAGLTPTGAAAASALAFAVLHGVSRSWWLAAAVLVPALWLALLYRQQRRLLPCVAWHAGFNAVWLLVASRAPAVLFVGGLALLGAGLPVTANAQNAANGKTLYNTRYGTQNQGCYSCHGVQGNTLVNNQKLRNGVNNPAVIQSAIDRNTGGMGFMKPFFNSTQVADIAAYLGNPSLAGASAPSANASPASVSFTATNVGANSATQTVTLANAGTSALALSAVAVSNPAFLVTGGTCAAGGSVAAGGSCTTILRFSPTAAGAVSGTLSFTHNASPATSSVTLGGTGVAASAVASVSPASLAFTQLVGSTSTAQTVSVTNTGTAPLTFTGTGFTGSNAAEFAVAAGGTCATGTPLAVNASCTYAVNFTPSAAAARTATLAIASNGGAASVSLSGTGTATPAAVIALNKNTLAFGSQVVGAAGAAQALTVSNSGQAVLTLSAVGVTGANAADFSVSGTCTAGAAVAVNGSCTLNVAFVAGAVGARAASVAITSNAANGAASATLGGTGTAAPAAAVLLAPSTLDFGSVTAGGAAVARAVSLTNTGNAALSISAITASGAGFAVTHNCGTSLAAGGTCAVTARFAPTALGAATGQIAVASGAAGSPHSVALAGTGVSTAVGVLSWSGSGSVTFADTALGASAAAQTLTLSNAGTGSATLSAVSVQGASAGEFMPGGTCAAGSVIAPGATCTVGVSFQPAQLGARTAQLSVASNGSDPVPATLSGNGIAAAQATLAVTPGTVSFASTVGSAAPPLTVALSNSGTSAITVTAMAFGSADFSWQPSAQGGCSAVPIALAAGQSCQIDVVLSPTAAGSLTDTLTLTSNATDPSLAKLQVSATVSGEKPAASNLGEGGCSIAEPGRGPFDPTLLLLLAGAAAAVWGRLRRGRPARRSTVRDRNA